MVRKYVNVMEIVNVFGVDHPGADAKEIWVLV
jgi:hypothetical protein